MSTKVDISKTSVQYLNLISDNEAKQVLGKGWTLSFVYSFQEIRDVYLAFCRYGQCGTVTEFSNKYVRGVIPFTKSPWDEKGRRVLEIKNALINFGLIDKKTLKCTKGVFQEVAPGAPLSDDDNMVFREIFFRYFRFMEYASLFLNPNMSSDEKRSLTEYRVLADSRVLFYYGFEGSRVDTLFYTLNHPDILFRFPVAENGKAKGGFLRFWDVFLSWAANLGLIERLNMKRQGFLLSDGKSFNACYFINTYCRINVREMLDTKFKRQLLIDISMLVMEVCMCFRCSINDAQQAIINYYLEHPETVSLIRTSEIFIKETELNSNDRILYPKYKGSFISHIKIREHE